MCLLVENPQSHGICEDFCSTLHRTTPSYYPRASNVFQSRRALVVELTKSIDMSVPSASSKCADFAGDAANQSFPCEVLRDYFLTFYYTLPPFPCPNFQVSLSIESCSNIHSLVLTCSLGVRGVPAAIDRKRDGHLACEKALMSTSQCVLFSVEVSFQ